MGNTRILAAGGLVWSDAERTAVLVVHRSRYGDWTLPKGKLEPHETFVAAALREVREETGCAAEITGWAGEAFYAVDGRSKSVLFWNMLPLPGAGPGIGDPDEVSEVRWMAPADAQNLLTYSDERTLVARNAKT